MANRFLCLIATVALGLSAALPGVPRAVAAVDPTLSGDALVLTTPGAAASVAAFALRVGATNVTTLDSLDIVLGHLDGAATRALAANVAVREIAADGGIAATDYRGNEGVNGNADNGGGNVNSNTGNPPTPSTPTPFLAGPLFRSGDADHGRGVTVAVIDSGVAPVADLAGKIVASADFVRDGATQPDPGGHGTYIAGLIAGTTTGVAPRARIVSLRVLNAQGVGTVGKALRAYDWLLRNSERYGVRVANISWGASQKSSYNTSVLAAATESLWFAGLTVVAAAGNDGPLAGTINMPGADPFVITAGSLDQQGTKTTSDDRESWWSSRGPTLFDRFAKPDLLAPGENVVSLRVPGSYLDVTFPGRRLDDPRYVRMSGTSVASAMVSGVAALMLAKRSSSTPNVVKTGLVATAQPVTGSVTRALSPAAVEFKPSRSTPLANARLHPSTLLLKVLALVFPGRQITWDNITWDTITWETITWEQITWENISWETLTWETVTWETLTWESVTWESVTWETIKWEAPRK